MPLTVLPSSCKLGHFVSQSFTHLPQCLILDYWSRSIGEHSQAFKNAYIYQTIYVWWMCSYVDRTLGHDTPFIVPPYVTHTLMSLLMEKIMLDNSQVAMDPFHCPIIKTINCVMLSCHVASQRIFDIY